MARLRSLIRMRRWELDQKQRELGELNKRAEAIVAEQYRLQREMESEQQTAMQHPEFAFTIAAYAAQVILRQDKLEQRLKALEQMIDEKREEIRIAFQEVKKIEIAEERRADLEKEALRHKEVLALDEIGLEGFRRQELARQQETSD
jgi:flagellar FliJ protein